MSPAEWSRWLKGRALEAGFDLCGVAAADGPYPSHDRFLAWLEAGYAGQMRYLAREVGRRCDPHEIMPEARSIVAVGMSSFAGDPPPVAESAGIVARYAWLPDYHRVFDRRLRALCRAIRERAPAAQVRAYVDTGPILERDVAARAGLGWIGRHSHLVSRAWGNWLLLGELITDLELKPDAPGRAHCGTCRRCLAACPTGALRGAYQLDARRCISYLTIELRGWIPRGARPLLGRHVFGCDRCLEACPWNRFARAAAASGLAARRGWDAPDLLACLELTEAEFQERFRGSALRRAKRSGLLRNCCVALGNIGRPEAVPALARRLLDSAEDPIVRGHAAWALGRLGGRAAAERLAAAAAQVGRERLLPPGRPQADWLQLLAEIDLGREDAAGRLPGAGA